MPNKNDLIESFNTAQRIQDESFSKYLDRIHQPQKLDCSSFLLFKKQVESFESSDQPYDCGTGV